MLLISANEFNDSAIATALCAVITTNLRLADAPGNVRLSARDGGLKRASVVNVSQVATVDKRFFGECVGTLSATAMNKVDAGLRLAMSL